MMKATKKRIIVFFIILICLFIMSLLIYHAVFYKPIPLVDGLAFGISPQRANSLFGAYDQKEDNTCNTGKNTYDYQTNVLGREAKISCFFLNDKELTDFHIEWINCDDSLFQDVYSSLYSHYSQKADFFEKTEESDQRGNSRITIGIDNGVTGIFYTIVKTGNTVTLSCVDNS